MVIVWCFVLVSLCDFRCGIRHFAGCGFGYGLLFLEFRWLSFMRVLVETRHWVAGRVASAF